MSFILLVLLLLCSSRYSFVSIHCYCLLPTIPPPACIFVGDDDDDDDVMDDLLPALPLLLLM